MTEKRKIDWSAVELDYRAGLKTDRQLGKEHGISHTAVRKRAVKEAWTRDLSARIRARAESMVSRQAVSSEAIKQRLATDRQVVEANAVLQADIVREHRVDIRKSRAIVKALLEELGAKGLTEDEVAQLAGVHARLRGIEDAKEVEKVVETFVKSLDLGARAVTAQKLVDALKNLVGLERQAFGIDRSSDAPQDMVEALRLLHKGVAA